MNEKKIVLDIQSNIHAHTVERMLMQEPDDCQVVFSESPDAAAEWCKTHRPDVLLMEVKVFCPGCSPSAWRSVIRLNAARKTAGSFSFWMTTQTVS